jgi:hypothetical protein
LSKEDKILESLVMAPLNQKLPWFKPSKVPDEYHQDIENGKKPSQRYYIVKIKGWRETEN